MANRPRGTIIRRGNSWSVVLGYKDAHGKWRKRWHSKHPETGEPLRSREDAERARTAILKAKDDGAYVPPDRNTLGAWLLEEWLPTKKPTGTGGRRHRGQVSIGTWDSYRIYVESYINPTLGHMRLQDVRPEHINRLYDELETSGGQDGKGLSAKTIANAHGVLHKALSDAVRQGRLSRNPADAVDAPRSEKATTDVWDLDQLRAFVRHIGADDYEAAWLLWLTTGARRGEVAGLSWEDVDLDAGTLRVTWTLGLVDNKVTWKHRPKSDAAERTMALDPDTVEALRRYRARQAQWRLAAGPGWITENTDWRDNTRTEVVFTWPDGSMINPERFTRWFSRHCDDAGLPRIRLHDVRHSYATAALASATGWHEVKVLSQRLGHASVGITLDTYSHALPAADTEMAHTLGRLIHGQGEAVNQ